MKNLFEIKTNGITYAVRDANTYRSLSDAQAIHLDDTLASEAGRTADGLYNGEEVITGEIFTCADGAFKQYAKERTGGENFTVVGNNITITDGVASGFAYDNAIEGNYTFNPQNSSWKITIPFTNGDTGYQQDMFAGGSLAVTIVNRTQLMAYLGSSIGLKYGQSGRYAANTKYLLEVSFDGSKYLFRYKAEGDTEWTTDFEVSSSTTIGAGGGVVLGNFEKYGHYSSDEFFQGSIDLNGVSIEVDGNVEWIPYSDTYSHTLTPLSYNKTQVDALITGGTTLDDIATAGDGIKFVETATQNFNVVGSLTINDGVASGFTNQTNYIATTYLFEPNNDTWEVYHKVKTSNDVNTMQFFHGVCNNHDYQCPLIGVWNGRFIISLSSNASSWNIASATSGSHSVQANTDYLVKLVFDGSSYKLYYKRGSDNDFVEDITISSSTKCVNCTTAYLGIGVNHYDSTSSGMEWLGSIDLNECYVKINDTITWQPYTQTSSKPAITADIATDQANAPTSSTEGYVGKLYITSGGAVYICTGVSGSTYTWSQITVS